MKTPYLPALLLLAVLLGAPQIAGSEEPAADETPASADLAKLVARLRPEVARIRGLRWTAPVPARMLTKAQLRAHYQMMTDRDYPADERARDNRIARRLGMLGEDEDIGAHLLAMAEEVFAGFYDPEEKALFVVEGPVGDGRIPTLFHELVHALDDQYIDFVATEKPYEDDNDRRFAARCLWEGCAVHAQNLFAEVAPEGARAEVRQEQEAPKAAKDKTPSVVTRMPTWLFVDTLLHYRAGPHLVGRLARDGLPQAMTRLLADPPTTQEQWLHPERWLDPAHRDLPRKIYWGGPWRRVGPPRAPRWKVVHDTPVGELNFALFLNHFLDDDDGRLTAAEIRSGQYVEARSYEAATGWDAGRSVVLQRGEGPMVIVHALAFDSDDDATQAEAALRLALQARNAEVWKTPKQWQMREAVRGKPAVYVDGRGMGCILRRANELLWLDGFAHPSTWDATTARAWAPLVAHLLKTRFVQDPRDRGDVTTGTPDLLAGAQFVLRRRGIAVKVPRGWTVRAPREPGPTVAIVSRRGVALHVLVQEHGLARRALPLLMAADVEDFDETALEEVQVAGWRGWRYPMQRLPSEHRDLYAGSDGVRIVAVLALGQPQIMRLYDTEIEAIVAQIVSVPGY